MVPSLPRPCDKQPCPAQLDGAATVAAIKGRAAGGLLLGRGCNGEDGRKLHDMFLFRAQPAGAFKKTWEVYDPVHTTPGSRRPDPCTPADASLMHTCGQAPAVARVPKALGAQPARQQRRKRGAIRHLRTSCDSQPRLRHALHHGRLHLYGRFSLGRLILPGSPALCVEAGGRREQITH